MDQGSWHCLESFVNHFFFCFFLPLRPICSVLSDRLFCFREWVSLFFGFLDWTVSFSACLKSYSTTICLHEIFELFSCMFSRFRTAGIVWNGLPGPFFLLLWGQSANLGWLSFYFLLLLLFGRLLCQPSGCPVRKNVVGVIDLRVWWLWRSWMTRL